MLSFERDSRTVVIDFWALDWAKTNVYDKFQRIRNQVASDRW